MLLSIAIALLPVPVFYLIYFRQFRAYYRAENRKPTFLKHLESFLYGIALALVIVLASPLIDLIFLSGSIFSEGFLKAALIEKLGAFIVIYFIQKHYSAVNAFESVISGILVGTGFSMVENIFYGINYGNSVIIIRTLFSAPLHLTTCGLIGYFIGISNLSSTRIERIFNILKAFILPFLIHGFFDVFLLMRGTFVYLIGPMIIIMVWILEIFKTKSKIVPSGDSLRKQHLRFEDWMLKYRQPRYERWILNSLGTSSSEFVPFFMAHRGKILWTLVIASFVIGGTFFPFRQAIAGIAGLNLNFEEQILVMSIYPVSIGLILSIVGSINSKFFTSSIVSLPVIFDAVVRFKGREKYLITFDITHSNCYLITSESLNAGKEPEAYFEMQNFKSPSVKVKVVWENHLLDSKNEPAGTILKFINPGFKFYTFLLRYYVFRLRKGIAFNLKLPGFQAIRSLFMQPETVMQKEVLYKPGSIVFRQGDEVSTFYYVKKGIVDVYKETSSGERIHIDTIEAGQIFNEMALLGERRRSVTAECRTQGVLAEANADNLEALIRYNPDFAYALVQKLAQRADQTQNYLSQTIEYLRNLVEISDRKTKNVSMLLAMSFGQIRTNEAMEFEINIADISRLLNISENEIIEYITSSINFKEKNHEKIASSKLNKLEKALQSLQVNLENKNGKFVISFPFNKKS
jgi:protease PrsW